MRSDVIASIKVLLGVGVAVVMIALGAYMARHADRIYQAQHHAEVPCKETQP